LFSFSSSSFFLSFWVIYLQSVVDEELRLEDVMAICSIGIVLFNDESVLNSSFWWAVLFFDDICFLKECNGASGCLRIMMKTQLFLMVK
jgi:hypothetical protein